jgi:hypothetical protein
MRLESKIEVLYNKLDKEHEAEQMLVGYAFSAIFGLA